MALNKAVLAPMPRASERTTTAVQPGVLRSARKPWRTSLSMMALDARCRLNVGSRRHRNATSPWPTARKPALPIGATIARTRRAEQRRRLPQLDRRSLGEGGSIRRVVMVPRTSCALLVSCALIASDAAAADDVVDLAASLIGRPYEWGAEGPKTFDCSGLTQYVYSRFGVDLPRRAINQSDFGEPTRRLQRGDLVFFSSGAGQSVVTHVGIYEGHGTMIDVSKRYG